VPYPTDSGLLVKAIRTMPHCGRDQVGDGATARGRAAGGVRRRRRVHSIAAKLRLRGKQQRGQAHCGAPDHR